MKCLPKRTLWTALQPNDGSKNDSLQCCLEFRISKQRIVIHSIWVVFRSVWILQFILCGSDEVSIQSVFNKTYIEDKPLTRTVIKTRKSLVNNFSQEHNLNITWQMKWNFWHKLWLSVGKRLVNNFLNNSTTPPPLSPNKY